MLGWSLCGFYLYSVLFQRDFKIAYKLRENIIKYELHREKINIET